MQVPLEEGPLTLRRLMGSGPLPALPVEPPRGCHILMPGHHHQALTSWMQGLAWAPAFITGPQKIPCDAQAEMEPER